ncbi:MAG: thiamine phosphate synthase [Solirubrobacteraceae bacterium]
MTPERRRDRFRAVRLYLVAPLTPGGRPLTDVATAAIAGGVDALQVRDKHAGDDEIVTALRALRPLCDATGTLLMVNDRPDLAVAGGADGVHVGQDDIAVSDARAVIGDDRLIGLSTHAPGEIDAAAAEGIADHIGVGPIHTTPTKAGRPAVGTALVEHAASGTLPFVAIGGIDPTNARAVVAAGARRIAVVRAITDAADPRAAAVTLRAFVDARGDRDPTPGPRTA